MFSSARGFSGQQLPAPSFLSDSGGTKSLQTPDGRVGPTANAAVQESRPRTLAARFGSVLSGGYTWRKRPRRPCRGDDGREWYDGSFVYSHQGWVRTLEKGGQEGTRIPWVAGGGWALCPVLYLSHFAVSSQRMKGPLGHFALSFFDKVPLPLFILTFYYENFPIQKGKNKQKLQQITVSLTCI